MNRRSFFASGLGSMAAIMLGKVKSLAFTSKGEGSLHTNTLNKLQSFKSGAVTEIAGMSGLIAGRIFRRCIDKFTARKRASRLFWTL